MSEETNKECKEYNSLKYRTMIMTGHNIEEETSGDTSQQQLDCFLMNEKQENEKQTWSKLSKTERLKKINNFIETNLISQYSLNEEETQKSKTFLNRLIERKRIMKVNEVSYNEETGQIENIPIILFNTKNRRFTLNHNLCSSGTKKTQKKKNK